jgi:hypothetical protein
MATQHAPIDLAERDLACAQLDELALAYYGQPWTAWKDAVLEWHLKAFATARAEAWIPGLAGRPHHDPVVKKFLSRFYRHHMHVAIRRLRAENIELRHKLLDAAEGVRFYAGGATDAGERAKAILRALLAPRAIPQRADRPPLHRSSPSGSQRPEPPDRNRAAPP